MGSAQEEDPLSWKPLSTDAGMDAPTVDGRIDRALRGTSESISLPARYEDRGSIGRGGMGEVRRVHDRHLSREVAMKVMLPLTAARPTLRRRFLTEAWVQAGLAHPAIVPLHDRGAFPDGRQWFTMREVHGRSGRSTIEAFHKAGAVSPTDLRRLLEGFATVCRAVDFAHRRGVLHRDLKPENLLFAHDHSVYLLDWGLALSFEPDSGEALALPEPEVEEQGRVVGTPQWMAPEQAQGATCSPATDIWALGGVLRAILSGRPPYRSAKIAFESLRSGVGPRSLASAPPVYGADALLETVRRAMSVSADDRHPTAGALGDEVQEWLDGAKRRRRARELVNRALADQSRCEMLRSEAERSRVRAAHALAALDPNAPVEDKQAAWALEDVASRDARRAASAEAKAERALYGALQLAPGLQTAREHLALLYRRRLEEAEARGDQEGATRAEVLLRTHDDGEHAAWLDGDGAISLATEPPGVRVTAAPLLEMGRRLVPGGDAPLGTSPLREAALGRGGHVVTLHWNEGPTSFPVQVGRQEHVVLGADIDSSPVLVRPPGLGPDDCWVPPGSFLSGGDPEAPDALPALELWLDGFVLRRHPVTVAEYIAFLDDLEATGRGDEAWERAPKLQAAAGEVKPVFEREGGRWRPGPDAKGTVWEPDWPVTLVDVASARAFCVWQATHDGLPWRLPHEQEWEKAARGPDRRPWPWGSHFEPTWTNMLASHGGPPRIESVAARPTDRSPYGVEGLAGNVKDICLNPWTRDGERGAGGPLVVDPSVPVAQWTAVRGGAWTATTPFCRPAARLAVRPTDRLTSVGFRLARSTPSLPALRMR